MKKKINYNVEYYNREYFDSPNNKEHFSGYLNTLYEIESPHYIRLVKLDYTNKDYKYSDDGLFDDRYDVVSEKQLIKNPLLYENLLEGTGNYWLLRYYNKVGYSHIDDFFNMNDFYDFNDTELFKLLTKEENKNMTINNWVLKKSPNRDITYYFENKYIGIENQNVFDLVYNNYTFEYGANITGDEYIEGKKTYDRYDKGKDIGAGTYDYNNNTFGDIDFNIYYESKSIIEKLYIFFDIYYKYYNTISVMDYSSNNNTSLYEILYPNNLNNNDLSNNELIF